MVPGFNMQTSAVDYVPVDPNMVWIWMDGIFPLFPQFPRTGRFLVVSRGCVIHLLRQGEPSQFIPELNQLGPRHIGASHLRTPWCLYKRLRVAHFFFALDPSTTLSSSVYLSSLCFSPRAIVTLAVLWFSVCVLYAFLFPFSYRPLSILSSTPSV